MKLPINKHVSKIYHFTFSQNMKASVYLQSVLFDLPLGKTNLYSEQLMVKREFLNIQ